MIRKFVVLPALVASLAFTGGAVAAVPTAIPYVGEVSISGGGGPFSGSVDVIAALYASPNGGTPTWGPHSLGTYEVDSGVLVFLIGGDGAPPVDAALHMNQVWLQLTLDGEEMVPRQQALSVPFARLAADSERLGGHPASAYALASALAPVATSGLSTHLVDGAELARVSDLADIAFTGDVAFLTGSPADSILANVFVNKSGDILFGDLDFNFNRALRARIQASSTPPAPCIAATLGLVYLDTAADELRICGVSGWKSGGGGGGSGGLTSFAAVQNPVVINQTSVPGACEPVVFGNFAASAASGFSAPQTTGAYTTSGCPASTCTGTLNPGATCIAYVRGNAVTSGPLAGSVAVAAVAGGTAVALLTGNALLSSGPQLAALTNPVLVDQVGYTGACVNVAFTNVGTSNASGFSAPVVTGPFTTLGCDPSTCSGSLAAGASCVVSVRGGSTSSGPIAGSVSLTASAGGTAVAALTGTATVGSGLRMAVSHAASPIVSIYEANSDPLAKISNPDVLPVGTGNDVVYSPDGTRLAVAHTSSPFVTVYNTGTVPYTKLANPAALPPASASGVAFAPNGGRLAVAHSTSPFVTIYDTSTTPYTKLANPGVLPPDTGRGVAFSPNGARMAVAHSTTVAPCVTIYQTTVVPFAKIDNVTGLTDTTCYAVAYSPDGKTLAVGHASSPFLSLFNTDTIPHPKLSAPAAGTIPSAAVLDVRWSSDGKYLAAAQNTSPGLVVYDTTTTPFTRLPNPSILPTGSCRSVAFSPDGRWVGVAHTSGSFATVYDTSTVPFSKLIGPNVPPASSAYGIDFGPY